MSLLDRFGRLINSYLNDFSDQTGRRLDSSRDPRRGDPDLDAAFDELNDFLNDKNSRFEKDSGKERTQYSWRDAETGNNSKQTKSNLPPDELRVDYELLGVPFGADEETCKSAYKKQIIAHHPDRHAKHEGNYKKATDRTARINAAWDRIEKYFNLTKKKNNTAGM